MKNIYSITYKELQKWCESINEKKFRAKQIYDWLYVKRISTIDEMSNLSKKLREELKKEFTIESLTEKTRQTSLDGTTKFLFNLQDSNSVETVLMNNKYGFSLCVSTQVGCRIGCSFCASTIGGLKRNLEAGEIVSQVLKVQKALDKEGERISSIVVMGTGEPFDNFDNTMKFIDIINNENGINIGARHITISTSGIVPRIYEFSDMKSQINFAISLHAPNDDLRSNLMKINQAYPLKELIEACKYYNQVTNRRLTFEYALFNGINDSEGNAIELAKLIKGIKCHVNLIPANDVIESKYFKSKSDRVKTFLNVLVHRGINATIRREQGSDIDAACGQLRSKYLDNK